MFTAIADYYRLARAGMTMARYDVVMPDDIKARLPWPGKVVGAILRALPGPGRKGRPGERFAHALEKLGPAYIKLGQFLATRPDLIGIEAATDLGVLKDKLPAFSIDKAQAMLKEEFGEDADRLFPKLDTAIAAASIAQVHRIQTPDGERAVKLLRPNVEKIIALELRAMRRAAKVAEKASAEGRRLRAVTFVETLAASLTRELDLRFEAGAASEFSEIVKTEDYYTAPEVDWERTSQRVLTTSWVTGTPMTQPGALVGVNRKEIANKVTRGFLASALDHGFFHADMHEGNMILLPPKKSDKIHGLALVDFGIMGRIGPKERLFLAEILNGFINRDYKRIAKVHFDAGYVPPEQKQDDFAQALRSVGEPIFGKTAENVSMGRLLMQLFDITHQFGMRMRPELVMLQKTMVQVEGVARAIDPQHDIWDAAKPVVQRWVAREFGPMGAARTTTELVRETADRLKRLPDVMDRFEAALVQLETPPEPVANKTPWLGWALAALLALGMIVLGVHTYWIWGAR